MSFKAAVFLQAESKTLMHGFRTPALARVSGVLFFPFQASDDCRQPAANLPQAAVLQIAANPAALTTEAMKATNGVGEP